MIRALAFLPYPTQRVPGQRFRIEQWAPGLAREGVEVAFRPFLSRRGMDVLYAPGHVLSKARALVAGYGRRIVHLKELDAGDVMFLFREATLLGPTFTERVIARRRPMVFDFDDAIYLPPANPPNALVSRLKSSRKTGRICQLAARVTVGNETLAAYARTQSEEVTVVPTTIDTETYSLTPRPPNLLPIVGWSGSTSTVPYLSTLEEPLRALRENVPFELRVIGGTPNLAGLDVRCLPWRAQSEVDDLRPMDVGLMPLPDDPWTRGKCGLKALQYMALGIPPVVSPVGVNADIVEDGVNGFHARSNAEWTERILLLLKQPDLRQRLGAAARRTVEERFSARVWVPRVAALLRGVAHQ